MAVIIGHAHLPEINSLALKRGPSVFDLDRSARRLRAALPNHFALGEIFLGEGHAQIVAGLQYAFFGAGKFPAQARLAHVDSERIDLIFAAEVFHRDWRLRLRWRGQQERSNYRWPS